MKNKIIGMFAIGCLLISGCADTFNKADFNGGLFTSSKADYIIVSQSGGRIMDVWKIRNSFVSSPKTSDGWIFKTTKGSLAIGGDAKIFRSSDNVADFAVVWEKYHEYHMEFESKTYREMYNEN